MQLQDKPFRQIKSGEKDIELRIFDEKRKKLNIGDDIVFRYVNTRETATCQIIDLVHRDTFSEIIDNGTKKVRSGFKENDDIDSLMSMYYSRDETTKPGVVGIVLKVMSQNK